MSQLFFAFKSALHFCHLHGAVGQNQTIVAGFVMILGIFGAPKNMKK